MTYRVEAIELPTGVTLEYVEQGNASAIPVLFLHGLSDSWHSFELVLPHLPASIRAIAVTQRGHGQSSHPDKGYDPDDFAADVVAFLDALHIDAAFVVGHSMGSSIAQLVAIEYPERTRGLVLVGSFFSLARSPVPQALWESGISTLEDPVDPGFVREFQESTLAQPVSQAFLDTVVHESLRVPARVWKEIIASGMKHDFSGQLNRIEAHTLLVWGDQDQMIPLDEQEALTRAIVDSKFVTYEGTGHAVHWESPQCFATDLVSFVNTDRALNA